MRDRLHRGLSIAAGGLFAAGLVAVGFIPPVAAVLSVPFLLVAARKPVLRRLALRNAARRPRETALILLGALLGTAIITGSATVGDTLGKSIRQGAFTQLGPIDEVVRSNGTEGRDRVLAAVSSVPRSDVDGILPALTIQAAVASVGERPEAEPSATVVEVDFGQAASFGGDPEATGIAGLTPAPGHVAIGRDLATTLGVEVGDPVEMFAYGDRRRFTVDRVLPRRGIAGYHTGFGSRSPTIFVPLGTVGEMVRANPAAGSPPTAIVAVSNRGGVIDGAALSEKVTRQIDAALAAAGVTAQTGTVKKNLLDAADEQGKSFTELFSALGTFSVLAGILLLVSIFIMLAEERKTELGMLRAVGLRRGGLVGSFALEGWMYALGSAALGTIAGLGVGRAIVFVTAGIFNQDERFTLDLVYTATLASVQRGFLFGFIAALITVLGTSLWISRLNVIRAIRDLPNPSVKRARAGVMVAGVLLALVGGLNTAAGLSAKAPPALLVGPPMVAFGVAMVLRRWLSRRLVDTIAAVVSLVWAVGCFDFVPDVFTNPEIFLFVFDGVVLTIAAVILVSRHQTLVGAVVRRIGGGSRSMSLRLGLAYPLARAFRTSLILMTFALVMFTLVSLTLFSSVFSGQIDDFTADISGGFDARALSNASNPAPPDAVRGVPGVDLVAPLATVGAQFRIPSRGGGTGPEDLDFWGLAGYDQSFVDHGPPSLGDVLPGYRTEVEVWTAVLNDPSLIIVDEFFLQNGGGPPEETVRPGEIVVVRDPVTAVTRELKVAGVADAGFGEAPAYMGVEGVRAIAGPRAVTNLLYIDMAPRVDAQDVAEQLNGRFVANGLDASSFRKLVGDGLAQQQQFFRLMQGYLSLGLVVSVAGIGVVMVRAVRERRREVGVLRSLGFATSQVRRAFVAESSFVALEGILVGTALAIVSSWRLLTSGAFGDGLEFTVPWSQVLLIVGLAFLATLAATASPAQQASRIQPAVALRITD